MEVEDTYRRGLNLLWRRHMDPDWSEEAHCREAADVTAAVSNFEKPWWCKSKSTIVLHRRTVPQTDLRKCRSTKVFQNVRRQEGMLESLSFTSWRPEYRNPEYQISDVSKLTLEVEAGNSGGSWLRKVNFKSWKSTSPDGPEVNIEAWRQKSILLVKVHLGVESQQLEWKVFVRCKEESIVSGGRS
jgi:hypothetical protein